MSAEPPPHDAPAVNPSRTSPRPRKLTITVLMGGPSDEREISLAGGREVARALAASGHRVFQGDVSPSSLGALARRGVDVVFPVLHGAFGEDGTLQGLLEQRRIRYTGSDAASSALAMDKHRAKLAFRATGVPTPDAVLIEADPAHSPAQLGRVLARIDLPCVVKPNSQGSSIGVVIARREAEAVDAVARTLVRYGDCLVERYIPGRELTVGLLGRTALPVLEVRPARPFYDYQAKYSDDRTRYLFDTHLPPPLLAEIQRHALQAFDALGCRDFARADLMLDEQNRPWFLEINTIPGFTTHSLLPKAAAHAGITMEQMCDQIVHLAYERDPGG